MRLTKAKVERPAGHGGDGRIVLVGDPGLIVGLMGDRSLLLGSQCRMPSGCCRADPVRQAFITATRSDLPTSTPDADEDRVFPCATGDMVVLLRLDVPRPVVVGWERRARERCLIEDERFGRCGRSRPCARRRGGVCSLRSRQVDFPPDVGRRCDLCPDLDGRRGRSRQRRRSVGSTETGPDAGLGSQARRGFDIVVVLVRWQPRQVVKRQGSKWTG
jgi:hypothetical protein